ncbi:DNA-binding protein [Thiomonas sp. 13-64-67]|jgi:chromosome segregation ATPase|uniref:DNA-binding protein n=1 Tax=Thiomonas sp. 13-64-67 TaxID=1970447 RepID=UPI000BD0E855|nr:DNA-binding protein [Thiomonas sp. 13-64-67]OZB54659.1 MAG: mucin-associated surface protein [Thiomonas sp. 15-63-373]OZB69354.1 MAG: mucin-associated surface protein [Thiomonas sp. 13-64-67]
MGREATITPEQVHAVADAIKAEGSKPTLRAVRERLGQGSMGTIAKLLQQWKVGQERQAAAELVLPPALQRAVLDFMAAELSATRAPLEAELAEQQQTAADLAAENERQADTITEQGEALDALAAEKAAAEGKAGQLAADLIGAKEEAVHERQAAEAARTELAKATLRLEAMPRLEADLAAIRAELAKERQGRIEAEQQAAVLTAQKADLEGRLVDAKKEAERTAAQLQRAQERAEQQAEALADARVTIQTAQARAEDLAGQVEQARKDAKAAGEEAAILRGQIAAQGERPASATAPKSKTPKA